MLGKYPSPSSPRVPSCAPYSSGSSPRLTLEGEDRSSGLCSYGLAGSHRNTLARPLRKGASRERREESSRPGELSHRLLLAGCLKLYQLQTKRVFRHKGRLNLASARPGLALEFRNPSPQNSQTGQTIPVALLPPHSRNAKSSSPGLNPIVDLGTN